MASVYALVDPRTKKVRYIGSTSCEISRSSEWKRQSWKKIIQVSARNPDLALWLLDLANEGWFPCFVVIKSRLSRSNAFELEFRLISESFEKNLGLLNVAGRRNNRH